MNKEPDFCDHYCCVGKRPFSTGKHWHFERFFVFTRRSAAMAHQMIFRGILRSCCYRSEFTWKRWRNEFQTVRLPHCLYQTLRVVVRGNVGTSGASFAYTAQVFQLFRSNCYVWLDMWANGKMHRRFYALKFQTQISSLHHVDVLRLLRVPGRTSVVSNPVFLQNDTNISLSSHGKSAQRQPNTTRRFWREGQLTSLGRQRPTTRTLCG